jgi:pantoate--beta-alanine ligase
VVTKLFSIVGPCRAYFGRKDAQQLAVVRRMTIDLDLPVEVVGCPLVREPDGLAMSSRNALLSAQERERALAIRRVLLGAREAVAGGEHHGTVVRARALAELAAAGVEPEYFELVDTETLTPVQEIDGEVLAVVAARVGRTRLIDNDTIYDGGRECMS